MVLVPEPEPPQVAIMGVESDVRKVWWPYLDDGRGGREQPLELG